MSHGFSIRTGTGSSVQYVSSDTPAGVFLDSFTFNWAPGAVVTRSYPSYFGSIIACVCSAESINWNGPFSNIAVSINNTTKTLTVSAMDTSNPAYRGNAQVVVIGT